MHKLPWTYTIIAVLLLTAFVEEAYPQTPEQNTALRYVKAGMEYMRTGNYREARDSFVEAVRYNDLDSTAHLGLGIAYFQLRDDSSAEQELMRAVQISPNDATAYQFLGELAYRRDDLETSVTFWEKAVALNPSADRLRERLERIKKEHRTEKDFNRDVTSHFLIKYEGREKIEIGRIVLSILEDAYGDIGRALSYYPDRDIPVILYSSQQFQDVTEAPGWSGGLFDGKIRIPIGGIERETPGLRKTLYHEYTHAVVRNLTRHCPTWLNEGLAQYFEGRDINADQRNLLRQIVQTGNLPPLSSLEGSFTALSTNDAMVAYLLSLSSVRYMIDSFGIYRVRTILDELATGATMNKAISNSILLSADEFERGWKLSLESAN